MTLRLLLAILCLIFSCMPATARAGEHRFAGMCDQCHREDGGEARTSATGFCLACHAIDPDRSHPILTIPGTPLPPGWTTDAEGRIDCVTCHYVCQSEKTGIHAQLRGSLPADQFCRNCHGAPRLPTAARHYGITGLAHPRLTLTMNSAHSGSMIDSYTRICLDCHADEGPGPGISFELAAGGGTALYNRHPVAVRYPDGYMSNSVLRPRHDLPDVILLVEGRISCISCHNLYRSTPGKLVADNSLSGLCLSCHRV